MKTSDLKPADYNPRKISAEELRKLKSAMQEFGDLGCIVKNVRTGNLVGGHQRIAAMGEAQWPITITDRFDAPDQVGTVALGYVQTNFGRWNYREVDWDEAREKAANIAANKHGGHWDDAKLKDLLVGLDDGSGLLDLTGFGEIELQGLIDRGADLGSISKLPSQSDKLFEQITLTLSRPQAEIVRAALRMAADAGPFGEDESLGNENQQGNALMRIIKQWGKDR